MQGFNLLCLHLERERNIARSAKSLYKAVGLGNKKISFRCEIS
jgi:hypothetical protein